MKLKRIVKYLAFTLFAVCIIMLGFVLPSKLIQKQDEQFLNVKKTDTRLTQAYQYKTTQYDVINLLYQTYGWEFEIAVGNITDEDSIITPEYIKSDNENELSRNKAIEAYIDEINTLQSLSVLPEFKLDRNRLDEFLEPIIISNGQTKIKFWTLNFEFINIDERTVSITMVMDEQNYKIYYVNIFDESIKMNISEMADGFSRYHEFGNVTLEEEYNYNESCISQYKTDPEEYNILVYQYMNYYVIFLGPL